MAFLLQGSVFIHVPKTGGQWVARALDNLGLIEKELGEVHASPDEIKDTPSYKSRPFRFCFVRHPLTWYQSIWSHRMDEEWEAIDDLDWFSPRWISAWANLTDECRSDEFTTFVSNCLDHFNQGFVSFLYRAYSEDCQFVGRQERLQQDLVFALKRAGESFDEDRLLSTRPRNVRGQQPKRRRQTPYTASLVERVLQVESWAVKRFGYQEVPEPIRRNLK